MKTYTIYYATNRKHKGPKRWEPTGYANDFSSDGRHNLRFGEIAVQADPATVASYLNHPVGGTEGDGEGLSNYLSKAASKGKIKAYEDLTSTSDTSVDQLASTRTFRGLRNLMAHQRDVVVYIHGFNVSWNQAVGAALALELMLNRNNQNGDKEVMVVLFSWPSDGKMIPYASYLSDRSQARDSGLAIGRAFLKLRDYLLAMAKNSEQHCGQNIHLCCHSMGNYALQSALKTMIYEQQSARLPRLFDHIFMCAADVDFDVFEKDKPMARLDEMANNITIYFNRGDVAMYIGDYTKGHPDRLGHVGTSNPYTISKKINQVRCTPVVSGMVEHSYYLWHRVNNDIRQNIDNLPLTDGRRHIKQDGSAREWVMVAQLN